MLELKKWVEVQAGASFSVIPFAGMLKSREMGKFRKQISCNSSFALSKRGAFTMAQKINLANRFCLNRELEREVNSFPLVRCLHLPFDRLITLSQDNTLSVNVRQKPGHYQRKDRYHLPTNNCIITDIVRSTKGDYMAYTSFDAYVYYFHIDRIEEPTSWNLFHSLHSTVWTWNISSCVCFNTDDKHLIAAEAGGQLCIIKTDRRVRYSFRAHQGDVTAVGCSKVNPHIFYTAGSDGLWKIWDDRSISNSAPTAGFATYTYSIAYIDADSYDSYVVTTSTCGTRVEVWDLRRFSEGIRKVPQEYFWRARFSPQFTGHRYIYSTTSSGVVHVFDIMTGEVKKFQKEGVTIYDSSWNPNECEIACATLLGTVMTYYHGDEQE